jgi:pectinesterase
MILKKIFLINAFLFVCFFAVAQQKYWTVSAVGTATYKTVQAALDAVPKNNKTAITIFIKKGVYKEKLHLDSSKNNVTIKGEDKFTTILTYNDHTGKLSPTGDTINTRTSASFVIKGNEVTLQNLTVQNDAGFTAGQAVGLEVQGDKAVIKNCRIVGNQDILFLNSESSRQYYEDCYIEGTTDFIFGSSTVWFERCHIHSKKNSHVTAAATPKEHSFGFVFNDCVLTGDTALNKVSLGRPWRQYASVVYIHCYLGQHLMPEGWANWNNTENYKTTRYAEFENFGPAASPATRVPWAKQLSKEEMKNYTLKNVFGRWDPLVQK